MWESATMESKHGPYYQKTVKFMHQNTSDMKDKYRNVLFGCWLLLGFAGTFDVLLSTTKVEFSLFSEAGESIT